MFYSEKVKDKSYRERVIRIAYDPIERVFKNADAATDRDPRYVSSVAEVFQADRDKTYYDYLDAFYDKINESNAKKGEEPISNEEKYAYAVGSTTCWRSRTTSRRRSPSPARLTRRWWPTSSCA